MSLLDAALAYAERDIPVFPVWGVADHGSCCCGDPECDRAGKHPLGRLVPNGVKDATTDEAMIRAWWEQESTANIGMPTTADLVLDVDPRHGGDQTLAELEAKHGALPEAPEVLTGGGGRHIYFEMPTPPLKNNVGKLGLGLDIRGDGGYVLLPPSRHVSGTYRDHPERPVGETPLPPVPAWMLEKLRKPSVSNSTNPAGWADDLINGVSEGTRDDRCWRLIRRYARLGLSEVEVQTIMLDWAARCHPRFDEARVLEKIDRTFRTLEDVRLLDLPQTDAGNAERMVLLAGDRFHWVLGQKRGEWLFWEGRRWAPQSDEAVKRIALDTARALGIAAVKLPSEDSRRKPLLRHALRSESAKAIGDAVKCAKLLEEVQVKREQLDSDPELLNVANGTLDLRTFELRPHDPADLITKITEIPYDPPAPCPLWLKVLDEIFEQNAALVEYFARIVGYWLTGLITEQCFWLLCGAGANGKSTVISVLSAMLGEYAKKIGQEAVLSAEKNKGRKATPELMEFIGARLAYVDEMEDDRQLDEARIKALTGSAKETGRQLYEGMRTWQNTAKLVFDLNTLPAFKGVDEGIARRPKVIPFNRKFEEAEQDKTLAQKLLAELPGILAWAVEGSKQWRQQGLNHPEIVTAATQDYVETQNHLPVFMAETYVRKANSTVARNELWAAYTSWCLANGEEMVTRATLNKYFKAVLKLKETKSHKVAKGWIGIALKTGGKEPADEGEGGTPGDTQSKTPPSTHAI